MDSVQLQQITISENYMQKKNCKNTEFTLQSKCIKLQYITFNFGLLNHGKTVKGCQITLKRHLTFRLNCTFTVL